MAGLYHFIVGESDSTIGSDRCRLLRELVPCLHDITDLSPSGNQAVVCNVSAGPDGKEGVLVYPRAPDAELPKVLWFKADVQEWMKVGDGKRWIGWLVNDKPTPADLRRDTLYPGYLMTDENEAVWSIPIARSPRAQLGSLPKNYVFGDDGEVETRLKSEFDELWEIGGEVWDYFNSPEDFSHDEAWLIKCAAQVLGVNYRVGPHEFNAMHRMGRPVLDDNTVRDVLLALIDNEVVTGLKKKEATTNGPTASDSSGSKTGDAVESQSTAPASVS